MSIPRNPVESRDYWLNILIEKLDKMDIPESRKKPQGLQDFVWLGRNLFVRNKNNPDFAEARNILMREFRVDVFGPKP